VRDYREESSSEANLHQLRDAPAGIEGLKPFEHPENFRIGLFGDLACAIVATPVRLHVAVCIGEPEFDPVRVRGELNLLPAVNLLRHFGQARSLVVDRLLDGDHRVGSFANACGSLAGCRRNVFRHTENNRLSKGETSAF
jgi:hypothetical protein